MTRSALVRVRELVRQAEFVADKFCRMPWSAKLDEDDARTVVTGLHMMRRRLRRARLLLGPA